MNEGPTGDRRLGQRDVLRIGDFRKLFAAQAISDLGNGMTSLALLLVVNQLTHSTTALAVLALALAVPAMVGGVVAGAVADRFNRRQIMVLSDATRALLVLGFIAVTTADRVPILYVLAFVQACIGTLFAPARGALIPRVVPGAGLLAANGLGQTAQLIAEVVGASLVGLLFAATGAAWPAFVADAATFAISAAIVVRIDQELGRTLSGPGAASRFGQSIVEGLRLVGRSATLIATIGGAAVAMFGLGAVNVLFVPFLINVLHESAAWSGPLQGAQSIAMVVSAALVTSFAARISAKAMLVAGLVGVGLSTAALHLAPSALAMLPILVVLGCFLSPSQVAVRTLVQSASADVGRGRVIGVLQDTTSTTIILSTLGAGVLAGFIGVREVILAGGLICASGGAVAAALFALDRGSSVRESSDPGPIETTDPSDATGVAGVSGS